MDKKEKNPLTEAEQIAHELQKAKEELEALTAVEKKEKKKKTKAAKEEKKVVAKAVKEDKKVAKEEKKVAKKEGKKKIAKEEKKIVAKEVKKITKKERKKKAKSAKEEKKVVAKAVKEDKKVAKEEKKAAKEAKKITKEEKKTYEEELEEQLSDEEIENFQIEKMDMEKLTNRVCDIVAAYEAEGMPQSELWKKLKLTSRDGSRLALKLERMGIITREKILEKGRWTYKLIIKKTPVSTESIENAPCLTCPVEQRCSLDGEISPLTCQLIEDWVLAESIKSKTKNK